MDLNELDTMENLMLEAPSSIEAFGQQIVAEEESKESVWGGVWSRLNLSI